MPFVATWMDLEIIILSEVSQKEKDKYMISLLCGIENMMQMNLGNRNRISVVGNRLVVAKGEGSGRGLDWEFGISRCKLSYIG